MLTPTTPPRGSRSASRADTASSPSLLKPSRFTSARSSGSRNRRGRGFPACGFGVTVPTSTNAKPWRSSAAKASAFLSKPAASPSGCGRARPASRQRRRGGGGQGCSRRGGGGGGGGRGGPPGGAGGGGRTGLRREGGAGRGWRAGAPAGGGGGRAPAGRAGLRAPGGRSRSAPLGDEAGVLEAGLAVDERLALDRHHP